MATGQNPKQTRVIDPINTRVVQGYRNGMFVGMALFPAVPVMASGGQVIEFGKEAFKLYNSMRSPGSGTRRVQFGYEGKPYAVENHSLEGVVPREYQRDAEQVPGIDQSSRAVRLTMRAIGLKLEVQQADLATDASNYGTSNKLDLSSTNEWDDYSNSTPTSDIDDAKEAVREQVGVEPNTLVLGAKVFKALKEHPKLIERIKYTSRESLTAEMIASLFDIERIFVGKGIVDRGTGTTEDIWGDNAVLAYVPANASMEYAPAEGMDREEPSYGYTYTLEGHPLVEQAYYDNNAKSWIFPVAHERAPVLSGIASGYLFTNCLT